MIKINSNSNFTTDGLKEVNGFFVNIAFCTNEGVRREKP